MSDGYRAYLEAVEGAFRADVDYAQPVKLYGNEADGHTWRYSPAECTGAKKVLIKGALDPKHISTFYGERQNLTIRMHMPRFTRLTNAFSKKVENHAYAVALHMMYYNFVRNLQKLRVSPAMAAGVSDRHWEIADIAKLVEKAEGLVKKRGPYKSKPRGDS